MASSQSSASRIAIVGAGCSGLAAAWALRAYSADVAIFEKSRGVSGRAATRSVEGCRIDLGANYFRAETPDVHDLVHKQLPTEDLIEITKPVWTFDQTGKISPGDALLDLEPMLNYRNGISTLGKLIANQVTATIQRETHVSKVTRFGQEWIVSFTDERPDFVADRVLLTIPAPQAAALLDIVAFEPATYHAQFAFALAFKGSPPADRPFHALLNLDRAHPIAWFSYENDKLGHVPEGQTVVIAQMAPSWTDTHYDVPHEEVARMVEEHVRALQPSLTTALKWWNGQGWRYAHPHSAANAEVLAALESDGLFFAGDALSGKGRVHLALQSGLDVGARLA